MVPTPAASGSLAPRRHGRLEIGLSQRAHEEPTVPSEVTGRDRQPPRRTARATAQRPDSTSRHSATSPATLFRNRRLVDGREIDLSPHPPRRSCRVGRADVVDRGWPGVAGRQSLAIWRLSGLSRRSRPVPAWLEGASDGSRGLLRVQPPRIVVAPSIRTPFVWCLTRPQLYWPSGPCRVADIGSRPPRCSPDERSLARSHCPRAGAPGQARPLGGLGRAIGRVAVVVEPGLPLRAVAASRERGAGVRRLGRGGAAALAAGLCRGIGRGFRTRFRIRAAGARLGRQHRRRSVLSTEIDHDPARSSAVQSIVARAPRRRPAGRRWPCPVG